MSVWINFPGFVTVGRSTIGATGRVLFAGPWSRVAARKEATCMLSGLEIKKGDRVYRPSTNGKERMQRVHAVHMEVRAAADERAGIQRPLRNLAFNEILQK